MKTLLTLLLLIPSLSWGKMISIKDYINSVSDLKNNEMFYLTARCNSLYTIIEGVSNGYPGFYNGYKRCSPSVHLSTETLPHFTKH